MYLSKAIDGYVMQSQAENKTAKTLKALKWHLGKFTQWNGDVPLDKLSAQNIRDFILYQQGRGLSGHSVHTDYKVLKSFSRWCVQEGLMASAPIEHIKPPRLPQLLPKILVPEQLECLLKRLKKDTRLVGQRNYLMVMMLLDCGLRANELVSLNVEDVYLDSFYILVKHGKGRKQRAVPFSPTLRRHLWKYIEDWRERFQPRSNSLFVTREGDRMDVDSLQQLLHRMLAEIGVKGSAHIFRHTCATLYLRNGGDLERLRLLLGHSSLTVTQRYIHLLPEDLVKRHSEISPLESVSR